MDAQLKKGILDMCILHIIKTNKVVYGYTLIKEISSIFPEINESTVYTILRRLHKNGNLNIEIKASSEGPQRKYYSLTEKGGQLLQLQYEEWRNLKEQLLKLNII